MINRNTPCGLHVEFRLVRALMTVFEKDFVTFLRASHGTPSFAFTPLYPLLNVVLIAPPTILLTTGFQR